MLRGFRDLFRAELSEQPRLREKQRQTIKTKEWMQSIRQQQSQQLKMHIYNFFITEGHYDLANTFANEASLTTPPIDRQMVQRRVGIKRLILDNRIDDAIVKLKEYELKEGKTQKQTQLIFALKCLKIINLIRENQIEIAIGTAREELLPFVKQHTQWLGQVEKVMSLIAFINQKEGQHSELMSAQHKHKIADQVNSYLLEDKSAQSLKMLMNLGKWCQNKLTIYAQFPKINPWAHDLYH